MSVPAPVVISSTNVIIAAIKRLSLPLVSTSTAIGLSMGIGDAICQYIQFTQSRTRLLEDHLISLKNLNPTLNLPLPDIEELLKYKPDLNHNPRVPSLPNSLLSISPYWWNPTRTLSMAATGVFFGGPWQFGLQRSAEYFFPGKTNKNVFKKMSMNILSAPFGISATFFLTNYFQGGTNDESALRIREEMPKTFLIGWMYWPFVSYANLKLVEVAYRPIVGSLAGCVWNIYVSAQANSNKSITKQETASEANNKPTPPTSSLQMAEGSR